MSEQQEPTPELNEKLFKAAKAGDLDCVKDCIAAGADVTYQADEGVTSLMTAAEEGHAGIVAALLEAGAPWNQQDDSGYCAGEYATASRNQDIVELLLEWGVQAELLLAAAERGKKESSTLGDSPDTTPAANASYLQQKLTYTPDGTKLLDADGEAVMMGWEAPLMKHHAAAICKQHKQQGAAAAAADGGGGGDGGGGHYLNVGFGLGIIDKEIQKYNPCSHTIIEAHPDVYAHMCELGWDKKPGVRILFGRWQDVTDQLQQYDGIFFDTYGEYYEELHQFHQLLPRILKPGGVYSYFNGLASDNFFFHMVYGRLVQVELQALNLSTRFEQLRVAELGDDVWQGVKNKYWHFPLYFLPVVAHADAAAAVADEQEDTAAVQQQPE